MKPIVFQNGSAESLVPIRFGDEGFSENDLQQILEGVPESLPYKDFDPFFDDSICIGRELPTQAGPLDLLMISPAGGLTLVETKLWKNPESRRKVLAQTFDYARCLAAWSYEDLEQKIQRYHKFELSLYDWLGQQEFGEQLPDSESEFVDSVSENLRNGRFLLLVIGDGIKGSLEQLVDFVRDYSQLQYRIGLIEMKCFRLNDCDAKLLVPRIVVKSKEIERSIVRIELSDDAKKLLSISELPPSGGPTSPGIESYYSKLKQATDEPTVQQVRKFVDDLTDQCGELSISGTTNLIVKTMVSDGENEKSRFVLAFRPGGTVWAGGQSHWKKWGPEHRAIIEEFWDSLGEIIPGIRPQVNANGNVTRPGVPVAQVLRYSSQVIEIVINYLSGVQSLV